MLSKIDNESHFQFLEGRFRYANFLRVVIQMEMLAGGG